MSNTQSQQPAHATSSAHTLRDILSIDLSTLKADTVVRSDGFVSLGPFLADGSSVLVSGTPRAPDGVGR